MNNIVKIKDFSDEIKIFYKDIEIGKCKSLLSFADIRAQISEEYLSESNEKGEEISDYSFEYEGNRIFFRKDSTYDMNGISFWEDDYISNIDKILKNKYGWKP